VIGRARRWARDRVEGSLDRRLSTDTGGYVDIPEVHRPELIWQDPSEWISLRRALRRLRVTDRDVFVDIGAGKGRAVMVAAAFFPFRRVIGLELSEELAGVARDNAARARGRLRARSVEIVTADALEWDIPDEASVIYLYCPFIGDVFSRFAERLAAWIDRRGRPAWVVYAYPAEHARLLETGRVAVVDVRPMRWPHRDRVGTDVIVTYRILPRGVSPEPGLARAVRRNLRGAEVWLGPHRPGFTWRRPGT
jgi:SAM-dependent methyltransferase